MKKLLSLPPNLVDSFHDITGLPQDEWFCSNDPVGHKLGSGGGTSWLLLEAFRHDTGQDGLSHPDAFAEWLRADRRVLVDAGGQSRRLPAYAPSGKVLTPIPVLRWERGQRLRQTVARPADTTLRTNHGQGTAVTPHHGSERRCTHQSHTTLAGYSRS